MEEKNELDALREKLLYKQKQGYDIIVVGRTRAAKADYWELKRAFEKTCKKLDLWETRT